MDESYYRNLIDKVDYNHKRMWGRNEMQNAGYDDFSMLWGLLWDEDANISPKTYFEAIDIFLYSFFGTIQDPNIVWRNVLKHYEQACKSDTEKEAFDSEFEKYLSQSLATIPDMSIVYDMMHLAIDNENLNLCQHITQHGPMAECWDAIEEDYENYPEWAAYCECFTDISYDKLPDNPIFKETIKTLYSKFGNSPNMEKLSTLYRRYFSPVEV